MVRSEGVEFVHAFTDGVVSGALEGSLYDPWVAPDRATLPAGELSQLLASSRVVVLALSPAANPDPELQRIRGHNVLSAYRCFTYLGTSTARLPTVLAPLGPIPDDQMAHFWIEFYERMSSSWDLTESLRHAQSKFQFSVPIALFSRHAGGKLFQARLQPDADARQLLARRVELLNSEHLTRALDQIRSKYGLELPESVNTLFKKESGRQQKLRGDLDAWTKLEGL
jgi:hypothetical protein